MLFSQRKETGDLANCDITNSISCTKKMEFISIGDHCKASTGQARTLETKDGITRSIMGVHGKPLAPLHYEKV
jgi:hypothetical protein